MMEDTNSVSTGVLRRWTRGQKVAAFAAAAVLSGGGFATLAMVTAGASLADTGADCYSDTTTPDVQNVLDSVTGTNAAKCLASAYGEATSTVGDGLAQTGNLASSTATNDGSADAQSGVTGVGGLDLGTSSNNISQAYADGEESYAQAGAGNGDTGHNSNNATSRATNDSGSYALAGNTLCFYGEGYCDGYFATGPNGSNNSASSNADGDSYALASAGDGMVWDFGLGSVSPESFLPWLCDSTSNNSASASASNGSDAYAFAGSCLEYYFDGPLSPMFGDTSGGGGSATASASNDSEAYAGADAGGIATAIANNDSYASAWAYGLGSNALATAANGGDAWASIWVGDGYTGTAVANGNNGVEVNGESGDLYALCYPSGDSSDLMSYSYGYITGTDIGCLSIGNQTSSDLSALE